MLEKFDLVEYEIATQLKKPKFIEESGQEVDIEIYKFESEGEALENFMTLKDSKDFSEVVLYKVESSFTKMCGQFNLK